MSTRPLSPADLLTPAEAVREVGGRASVTRAWLEDRGLIRDVPALGRRVIWGDVLEAIRRAGEPAPPPPGPPSRLRRAGLRRT